LTQYIKCVLNAPDLRVVHLKVLNDYQLKTGTFNGQALGFGPLMLPDVQVILELFVFSLNQLHM